MNSDHNPVVVKIDMKLKRANATKRIDQLELNLLKEETYKYNVEVQNIYERLCIEETEQQPDNGSFNNQCDKKWTSVKQSIKSSLNAILPKKANREKQKWMTDHILNLKENRKHFKNSDKDAYNRLINTFIWSRNMDTNWSNIRQIRGFWNVAIQENVKNIMERTQN